MQTFTFEFYILSLLIVSKYHAVATELDAEKIAAVTREQTTDEVKVADASDGTSKSIEPQPATENNVFKQRVSPLEQYKKLFTEHRATQLNAVKSMTKFGNSEAQYKLIEIMLNQLFKNLFDASQNLTSWGFIPGDDFPTNETIRESMSKILENTALFGDLILRMPNVVHDFYDKNRDWHMMLRWAYDFSLQSTVFEGPHEKLLSLMAQEADIIPKSPNYVNHFVEVQKDDKDKIAVSMINKKPKEKKAKKIPRGPRMSRTEL